MKLKWKVIIGLAIVIVAVGLFSTLALQGLAVEVAEVKRGSLEKSFTEEGVVVPAEERVVTTLYPSRITELLVEEGSIVNEGDLIAILDDSEFKYALQELNARLIGLHGEEMLLDQGPGSAELKSVELAIKQAEEIRDAAKSNYDRIKELFDIDPNYELELQQAKNLLMEAEHNLARQKKALDLLKEAYKPSKGSKEIIAAQRSAVISQIELIKYQQKNYFIHAPIAGVVVDVSVEEGGLTGPQIPLMRLFRPDDYCVEVRILTRDLDDITIDMPVKLSLHIRDGEREFTGRVTAIAPYAESALSPLGLEEERVKVTILPQIPDNLKIAPGYKLDVEFIVDKATNVLKVPKSAVFSFQGEKALFVAEDGRARVRTVTTGLETRQEVVIISGLTEGELVVVDYQVGGIDEGKRISSNRTNND